jgi:hypothetical protein
MTECESVRGEWGGICPDCGQQLPNPGPIQSWQATREPRDGWTSGSSAGLGERPIERSKMARTPKPASQFHINRPAPAPYRLNARQAEMLAAVQLHGGNRSAAARDLGVTPPAVDFCMRRLALHGVPVPPPSRVRTRRVA